MNTMKTVPYKSIKYVNDFTKKVKDMLTNLKIICQKHLTKQ